MVLHETAGLFTGSRNGAITWWNVTDARLDPALVAEGFSAMPMPARHLLKVDPDQPHAFIDQLSRRQRRHLRRRLDAHARFESKIAGPQTDWQALWNMYWEVARRHLEFNLFPLPRALFPALAEDPAWEIVTLHLPVSEGGPADGHPVAFFAAHHHGEQYAALVCGLDYDYVRTEGAYRHMLLEIALRAQARGARTVHYGMEAAMEKVRLGCTVHPANAWMFARDTWQASQLRHLAERLALEGTSRG